MAPPLLVFRLLRQSHVRLSHLSAVAVMIALVGAMFVAMGSASAESPAIVAPVRTSDRLQLPESGD